MQRCQTAHSIHALKPMPLKQILARFYLYSVQLKKWEHLQLLNCAQRTPQQLKY